MGRRYTVQIQVCKSGLVFYYLIRIIVHVPYLTDLYQIYSSKQSFQSFFSSQNRLYKARSAKRQYDIFGLSRASQTRTWPVLRSILNSTLFIIFGRWVVCYPSYHVETLTNVYFFKFFFKPDKTVAKMFIFSTLIGLIQKISASKRPAAGG